MAVGLAAGLRALWILPSLGELPKAGMLSLCAAALCVYIWTLCLSVCLPILSWTLSPVLRLFIRFSCFHIFLKPVELNAVKAVTGSHCTMQTCQMCDPGALECISRDLSEDKLFNGRAFQSHIIFGLDTKATPWSSLIYRLLQETPGGGGVPPGSTEVHYEAE